MTKGIVYIVRNPAFYHLIKIGLTTKSCAKDRGLDSSNVPEDYKVLYAYECNNPKEIEAHLHELFKMYRHYTATGRQTEFFYIGCLADAKASLKMLEKAGNRNITEELQEEIKENQNDVNVYDETKKLIFPYRRKAFNFEEMGIPAGTVLNFVKDPSIAVKVVDNRLVEYQNKQWAFSEITARLLKNKNKYCQPTKHWLYNGKNVGEIYDETYTENVISARTC
ncbi:hypothetical protein tpqmel_0126 [Candidatus Gastranaerophilus sp. (ex Termes propinquus)]|nr:hypothetical protein tpqmel_0126 [Candidatus Gastranaerophilus sp. (ex Termes propinquus)]